MEMGEENNCCSNCECFGIGEVFQVYLKALFPTLVSLLRVVTVSVHGLLLMAFDDFPDGSKEKETQIQKVRTHFESLAC